MYFKKVGRGNSFFIKNKRLTTGLKWAPEIEEKLFIKTKRIAHVEIVFPNNAIASLPWERFSAMIPEPITTPVKKKVPINSTISE